jgi:MFS family permease
MAVAGIADKYDGPSAMPTLIHTRQADDLDQRLRPRDDAMVAERVVASSDGTTVFEAIDGPFLRWRREVEVLDGAVVERFDYQLGLGPWNVIFSPLVRRRIRRDDTTTTSAWWSPPDRLDPRAAGTLAACGMFAVVGGFLAGMLSISLTFVAADFGVGVSDQALVLSVVRVGALATFAGLWLADRRGRRPLVIWTFVLAALTSGLTAAAPSLAVVAVLQTACRGLAVVGILLLPIIAVEEVPAGSRAYVTGILAMAAGLGGGAVIAMLPLADAAPWAWRLIYLSALVTIPATLAVGRAIPESRRFEALSQQTGGRQAVVQGRRVVVLGLAILLINIFQAPVSQLQNEFLRDARNFTASRITLFIVATNVLASVGIVVGGELADRRGRHRVATVGLLGFAIGNAAMYATSGWPMWAWSTVGSAVGAALVPTFGVLNPELFPTARRGGASGGLNIVGVIGSVAGLLVAGSLIERWGYGPTFALLAIGPLAGIFLLGALPETAGVPLEDINPGDVSSETADGPPP